MRMRGTIKMARVCLLSMTTLYIKKERNYIGSNSFFLFTLIRAVWKWIRMFFPGNASGVKNFTHRWWAFALPLFTWLKMEIDIFTCIHFYRSWRCMGFKIFITNSHWTWSQFSIDTGLKSKKVVLSLD